MYIMMDMARTKLAEEADVEQKRFLSEDFTDQVYLPCCGFL
jgi:hypothetical protein